MSEQGRRVRVLTGGICSLILAMGIARFAYTPLLPIMQRYAGLGLTEAGVLAAINYAGYLTGAIITSLISSNTLKLRLYVGGLLLAVATTAMMGTSQSVVVWGLSRYLAGISTAAGMLLGSGLILNWLIRHHHRGELGVHFAGVGLGIVFCSGAVALMAPALGWREQWYALALMGAVLLVPGLLWLPDSENSGSPKRAPLPLARPPTRWFLRLFMAAYFCAGIGYVVSGTFIVSIVDGLPGLQGKGTLIFLLIGLAGAPSCILWDLVARRIGDLNAVILSSTLQIGGIVLPIWPGGLAGALVGALLFGATVMGLVSLVLSMAGRYFPENPAKMIGKMSIAYGSAQIVGPALTGWMARAQGGYASGLYMAALAMAAGVGMLLMLRSMEREHLRHTEPGYRGERATSSSQ